MLTPREQHLLYMILHFPICRYMLCNEYGRIDGTERADLHIYISKILCHFLSCEGGLDTIKHLTDEYPKGWKEVHDWLAHNLTDRMDETIDFIIDRRPRQDERDACIEKFFNFICEHIDEIEQTMLAAED